MGPARTSLPAAAALVSSIGRLHIVAIAALGVLTFGWALTGVRPFDLALIAGLDWFVVNLLNRVVDLEEDQVNHIRGVEVVRRHRGLVLVVGFGTLAASLPLVHLLHPELTPLRLGYHLLGFAYNWRLLPGGRRIKELYFWKNTASAVGFLMTVFGYPLVAAGPLAGDVSAATIAWSAAFFFLFELSYEVIYDLRDAPGDAAAGVQTYPVVYGERGALWVVDGLLLASATILTVGSAAGAVPWRISVMIVAVALQLVLYKRAVKRGITSAFCVGLTWLGAGLLATYHVWAWLQLPGTFPIPPPGPS